MSSRRRAVLLGGLALALGGLAALNVAGREAALARRIGGLVDIVVAREPVPAGARVRARALAVRRVPERFAPAGRIGMAQVLVGRRAAVDIPVGADMTPALVVGDDAGPVGPPVGRGDRIAEVVALGSPELVVPGGRVDVLVTPEPSADGPGEALLALEDVEVPASGCRHRRAARHPPAAPSWSRAGPDDTAASQVTAALRTGWPLLRGYRRAPGANMAAKVFEGRLAPIGETADEGSTMQLVARSPLWRLGGRYLLSAQQGVAGAQPDGTLITNLLAYADFWQGSSGLTIGNVDAGTPSHAYSFAAGGSIGGSVQQLTALLDGVDVVERFDAVATYLDVVASAGSVKPNATFQYGDGTLANLRQVAKTTAPPINYVILLGADGLISVAQHAASQVTYGTWPLPPVSAPATGSQAMLDSLAQAMLRPLPVTTVQMTPESNAPRPFDDFALADTVPVYASRGSLQINSQARVNAFTVRIDDNGLESSEIPDPQSPEQELSLRAQLELEVLA